MHPTLNIAIKAARRAGQIINRASLDLERIKVGVKQQSDFVTEVDRAAEALRLVRRGGPALRHPGEWAVLPGRDQA